MQYGFYKYALQIHYVLLLEDHLPRTQKHLRPERDCLEHHGEKLSKLCDYMTFFKNESSGSQGKS